VGASRPFFAHNYTINTHKNQYKLASQFLANYASMREMGYLRNDKIYSGNTRLKKVPESGAKTNPTRILWGIYLFLAAQEIFYLWLMKDLRPTHERKG